MSFARGFEKQASWQQKAFGLRMKHYAPAIAGTALGAGIGGATGYAEAAVDPKATTGDKVIDTVGGALLGGALGYGMARSSMTDRARHRGQTQRTYKRRQAWENEDKRWEDWRERQQGGSRGSSGRSYGDYGGFRSSANAEHKATLGFDKTPPKTKAEAKKAYRDAAMKHHPDRGGNEEMMKKVNEAWEHYQKSDEFNKLAMLLFKRINK